MNKGELLKFAVESRRDLIEKISRKAEQYGITEENQELNMTEEYGQLIVNDKAFPVEKKHALDTLQGRLRAIGYHQLIEETAYTWFNRIIAIRYMEVNNYLPDRVNVLSSATGKSEPDILSQYETMKIDVNHEEINEFMRKGENEQAYRKLFIAQCNALSRLLPTLFEEIEDYAELLLPDYLLDQESIILKIVNELSESNFYEMLEDGTKKDNVEVLGWLYQYYMSERKEKVGGLKNTAVKKEDLPVVTQLFTPKWIVQYMLQNSLGKIYDEKYEDNQLVKHWEYYLKHEGNHHLYPEFESLEDLKITDPACGSGHILVYAFDMLYDMYEEAGYPSREIPQLILEKNLYGLDIDKRAQQIANFALIMKAAEKQPRFISRLSRRGTTPKLNVYEIVDADQAFSPEVIDFFVKDETEKTLIIELLEQFENGKQFGSLITPIEAPYEEWINRIHEFRELPQDLIEESYAKELKVKLLPVLKQAYLLHQKYDVVVTNPPYHSKFNIVLKDFMNLKYNAFKQDLYSAFIYRTTKMLRTDGYSALMTPFTWMFITTHGQLRDILINEHSISSLIQPEYSAFKEATVPICSFVIHNQNKDKKGVYIKLTEFKGEELQPLKLKEASLNSKVDYRYYTSSDNYKRIKSNPLAYWITEAGSDAFLADDYIGDIAPAKKGLDSNGESSKFYRFWFEVESTKFFGTSKNEQSKWFEIDKGGGYKKWYGNRLDVLNYENEGFVLKNKKKKANIRNESFYRKESITYGVVSSSRISFRLSSEESIFDQGGPNLFPSKENLYYILALGNSIVYEHLLEFIAPTLNFTVGDINKMPVFIPDKEVFQKVIELSKENTSKSKENWDSFEMSWDFDRHPLLKYKKTSLKTIREIESRKVLGNINTVLNNEAALDKYFIELYGLTEDIPLDSLERETTLIEEDDKQAAISFISYFIGCVMGRYSLDIEGLAYAGGHFDSTKYKSFKPNSSGLFMLTDDYYFDNDIIVRLKEFLSVAFSPDTVNENINWLAESLKMKKGEVPEDRLRRYFLDEFFRDHCQMYKKHPIYWLVDSGRQKGLRTLVYMHRYQEDTMATIRFEHLQEIQSKYQNEIKMIDTRIANPSLTATAKRDLERSKTAYQRKIEELQEFDKHLATYANQQLPIDLDDGVKVNYAKFDKVLAKIR